MFSETPALESIAPAYHIRILSDEQLDQFKSSTFEFLEEPGIHCPSDRALQLFQVRQFIIPSCRACPIHEREHTTVMDQRSMQLV